MRCIRVILFASVMAAASTSPVAAATAVNTSLTLRALDSQRLFDGNWISGGGVNLSGLNLATITQSSALSTSTTLFTIDSRIVPVSTMSRLSVTDYVFSSRITTPSPIGNERAKASQFSSAPDWVRIGSISSFDIGGTFSDIQAIINIDASGPGRGVVTYEFMFDGSDEFGERHTFTRSFGASAYRKSYESVLNFPTRNNSGYGIFWRKVLVEAAIPEPMTWMQLLVGFGVLGVAMRVRHAGDRKRKFG